ncbi:MAG: thioredoxin domain-containing protein [Proteobacteria bacterium]|nr:thioredoxin domain-containing protein [Pseudomonadota bacterium]
MAKSGKNRLKSTASPYLLQHAENPVHWWPWSGEALAAAKAENKPILLSVGYAACHWCHVMAHESFEDAETAALMNDLYINIKVDREERPDLDVIYQRALGLMGQPGGWPLTMFLAPDGVPFWGGTYFPKKPQYGRADFKTVLKQIHKTYTSNPEAVKQNQAALLEGLIETLKPGTAENISEATYWSAAELIYSHTNPAGEAANQAPKFPNMPLLNFLWRAGIRSGRKDYKEAVTQTLTQICQGGIYDHLGGGLCRYSTDRYWLAPHFEKMLYDNALFVDMLCEVWKEIKKPLFKARVRETIGWLFREMTTPGGGFCSALDADSEGEEGKFYVWTKTEVETVLGKHADAFNKYYGVEEGGNWEGNSILNRLHDLGGFDPKQEKFLEPLRQKLLSFRNRRPRPFKDDKVLADWNGLMISALVKAGQTFSENSWLKAAEKAFDFIKGPMCEEALLHHSWRGGRLGPVAFLDDYAAMIGASIALFTASEDEKYLSMAKIWVSEAEKWLSSPDSGDFFASSSKNTDLIVRPRINIDQATPAGGSLMIENYVSLYRLTGNEAYRSRAGKLLRALAGAADKSPLACPSYFSAFDTDRFGAHLLIKDQRGSGAAKELRAEAVRHSFPGLTVQVVAEETRGLPEWARALKSGSALLCQGSKCSLPLTNSAMLREELVRLRQIKPDPGI